MTPPKVIWLQIGEFTDLEELEEIHHLAWGDISWCDHQIYENDIRYVLDEKALKTRKEWEQAQEGFIR